MVIIVNREKKYCISCLSMYIQQGIAKFAAEVGAGIGDGVGVGSYVYQMRNPFYACMQRNKFLAQGIHKLYNKP